MALQVQHQAVVAALTQFTQAQQASAQAAQNLQVACANLPGPDEALHQQIAQTIQRQLDTLQQELLTQNRQLQQQTQRQVDAIQLSVTRHQDAMQAQFTGLRNGFTAVSNSVVRLSNGKLSRNRPLQWLQNGQGQLPAHQPCTRRTINSVNLQQINLLLQHYDLFQHANVNNLNAMDRRWLLLEYLGAEVVEDQDDLPPGNAPVGNAAAFLIAQPAVDAAAAAGVPGAANAEAAGNAAAPNALGAPNVQPAVDAAAAGVPGAANAEAAGNAAAPNALGAPNLPPAGNAVVANVAAE